MRTALFLLLGISSITGYLIWNAPEELEPLDFQIALLEHSNGLLIDVRTRNEFSEGHIPGAMNIDWYSPAFHARVAELDSTKHVFLYCKAGGRSSEAARLFRSKGFVAVTELKGGLARWQKESLPKTPLELIPPDDLTIMQFSRMLDLQHDVLVDFYLPWDENCQKMESVIDEIAIAYSENLKVLRINIDKYKYLATELGLEEVPHLQFYENGNLTFNWVGITSRQQIEKRLSTYVLQASLKTY